jgi:hypothetical protein
MSEDEGAWVKPSRALNFLTRKEGIIGEQRRSTVRKVIIKLITCRQVHPRDTYTATKYHA